jgi:predicted  nucleic acid-binding Zn-ribbon protein
MQLHIARLCLDCEEVHDQQTCPICSSESFAYISRWIPAPERRRTRPRVQEPDETASVYKQLLNPEPKTSGTRRWVKRGVLGLTAVGIAGWALRKKPPSS